MVLCDNVFCSGEIIEFEYVPLTGRKFCCVACADAWRQQNEALDTAATPLRDFGGNEGRRVTRWPSAARKSLALL